MNETDKIDVMLRGRVDEFREAVDAHIKLRTRRIYYKTIDDVRDDVISLYESAGKTPVVGEIFSSDYGWKAFMYEKLILVKLWDDDDRTLCVDGNGHYAEFKHPIKQVEAKMGEGGHVTFQWFNPKRLLYLKQMAEEMRQALEHLDHDDEIYQIYSDILAKVE